MSISRKRVLLGAFLSLGGFSAFSFGDAVNKHLSQSNSIFAMVFFNSLFSILLLSMASPWLGGLRETLRTGSLRMHVFRSALLFTNFILGIYAFRAFPMAKVYAILFMAPFFAILLSFFIFRDKTPLSIWALVAAGMVGVLLILRPGFIAPELPAFAALTASFCFAFSMVLMKWKDMSSETALSHSFYPLLFFMLAAGALMIPGFTMPTPSSLVLMAFSGLMTGAGMILVSQAFAFAPSAIAASFNYVQILWAVIFGVLIFRDSVDLWTVSGVIIIVFCGLLMIFAQSRKREIPDGIEG